ncbi:MAG: hypothetical protein ABIN79_01640 [Marmoricola sp.]
MSTHSVDQSVTTKLTELRTALEQARSMPMSASAVVNRAEVLGLVDRVEEALQHAVADAGEVVGERDSVVASGQDRADEILRQAHSESERLVGETNVYQVAAARAAELEETATRETEALRVETEKYIEEKLANFELTLERTLDVVRRGRARISQGVVHGLGDDSDVADMELPEHLDG